VERRSIARGKPALRYRFVGAARIDNSRPRNVLASLTQRFRRKSLRLALRRAIEDGFWRVDEAAVFAGTTRERLKRLG
jgi:hypothetical protein